MTSKPVADETARKLPGKPFKSGDEWNGNRQGRPKGARSRLTTDFVQALAEDFDKHGKAAISTVREEDPGKYLDIVSKLVPRDVDVNVTGSAAFERIWRMIGEGVAATLPDDRGVDDHTVN